MKLNNKGLTLIELLISIVLISVVLVFLLRMLADLRSEKDNNSFVFENQVNRTEAIYTIQNDFNNYVITDIVNTTSNSTKKLVVKVEFAGGITSTITFCSDKDDECDKSSRREKDNPKYYLKYTSANGTAYKWEMKDAIVDFNPEFVFYNNDTNSNKYYFKLQVKLYNKIPNSLNDEKVNNAIDDIILLYAGNDNLKEGAFSTFQ